MPEAAERLAVRAVSHRYGNRRAVDRVSLTVAAGEIVCLLGPSGCGKSTLLRVIAGLETLQAGAVALDGRTVARPGAEIPPEARRVGLVFQDHALFPHLDVRRNVAFGVRGSAGEKAVTALLTQMGLLELATAYPHELSGGQQQRVAVARALAPAPLVTLLDEPFSGLDSRLRHQVRDEVLHILKDGGAGTLMVTHDPEEAMFMADRIAVMRNGTLVQIGTPSKLYFEPANAFVATLFGEANRFTGHARDGTTDSPFGPIPVNGIEGPVEILIRPEALRPAGQAGPPDAGTLAHVRAARLLGRTSLVHLELAPAAGHDAAHIHMRVPGCFLPAATTTLQLELNPAQVFVFPLARG